MANSKLICTLAGSVLALLAGCAGAIAADFGGGAKEEPSEKREFTYSFNIGLVSDYRYRGISLSAEDPVLQGGADIGYGIWYAGIWATTTDYGDNDAGQGVVPVEIDYYTGIKPEYRGVTFDLGIIYYTNPGALDDGDPVNNNPLEQDYVELKVGASTTIRENLSLGITGYYSPESAGQIGTGLEIDGTVGYTLPKFWVFEPLVNAWLGYQYIEEADFDLSGGDTSYVWWNAGLTLTVDSLSLDFRYWDTDISDEFGACSGPVFQCDATFVFSAKIAIE